MQPAWSHRVQGTWFEFFHHSKVEGQYWNPRCRQYTAQDWRSVVQHIAAAGMEYIVLMCSSLCYADSAESYFPGGPYPPAEMACANPLQVLMEEAERLGLRVFMSCGFYGDWTQARQNMQSDTVQRTAFEAMAQLYRLYGNYKSFFGWYLPDEIGIDGHFPDFFIRYVNAYRQCIQQISPEKPLLIAPYGIAKITFDTLFVQQLKQLDCEYIAYQDGVGIRNGGVEIAQEAFRQLKLAHDAAAKAELWADMEVFRFEGEAYRSALLPADEQRITQQLDAISPYVKNILVYQFAHIYT